MVRRKENAAFQEKLVVFRIGYLKSAIHGAFFVLWVHLPVLFFIFRWRRINLRALAAL